MALQYGNNEAVYQGLINRGFNPAAAAGVAANAGAESSFNPTAFNGDDRGAPSEGLFQWRAGRRDNLHAFAGDRSVSDLDTQLDFLVHEMANNPGDANITLEELNAFDDPVAAGNAFRGRFERPHGTSGYESMRGHASDIYNQFSGLEAKAYDPQQPGYAFAADADERSRGIQEILKQKVEKDDTASLMMMRAMMPGNFAKTMSQGDPTAQPKPQNMRGQPNVGYSQGQPQGGSAPSSGGGGGSRTAAASTKSDNPEADPMKKPNLMERIFRQDKDEAEVEGGTPWYRRNSFTDTLAGLSRGLSQMSHGQPIDVMGPVSDLRQLRAQRQAMAGDEEQQAFDNQIKAATLNNQLAQSSLSVDRLALDREKFEAENAPGGGGNFDWTPYETAVGNDANLGALLHGARNGPTPEIREEAYKQLTQGLESLGTATGLSDQFSISPEGANLIRGVTTGTIEPEKARADILGLTDPRERGELTKALDDVEAGRESGLTSNIREANKLWGNMSPSEQGETSYNEVLNGVSRTNASIDDRVADQQALAVAKANQERLTTLRQESTVDAESANELGPLIYDMLDTSVAVHNQGGNTGPLTGFMSSALKLADEVGADVVKDAIEGGLGYSSEQAELLTRDGTAFMYGMMKQMGFGGAGFTEKEAAMLRSVVPSEANSTTGRITALSRVMAGGAIDNAAASVYNNATPNSIKDDEYYVRTGLSKYNYTLSKLIEFDARTKLGGDDPSVEHRVEELSKQYNAISGENAAEQRRSFLDDNNLTYDQLEAHNSRKYARMELKDAKLLSRNVPQLNRIVDSNGNAYHKQSDGSWKLLGNVNED